MNRLCHQVFPRSAFPCYQNGYVRFGNLIDHRPDLVHRVEKTEEKVILVIRVFETSQLIQLLLLSRTIKGHLDFYEQLLVIEGLLDVICRPELHRPDHLLDFRLSGNEYDRQESVSISKARDEVYAVSIGEINIENDERRVVLIKYLDGLIFG